MRGTPGERVLSGVFAVLKYGKGRGATTSPQDFWQRKEAKRQQVRWKG